MRLFFALDLTDEFRFHVGTLCARASSLFEKNYSITPEQNLHLTLRFLGDCSQEQVQALVSSSRKTLEDQPSFELEFNALGSFPRRERSKILWLGADPTHELQILVDRLEALAREIGFEPDERPFQPHITIARLRRRCRAFPLEELLSVEFEPMKHSFSHCSLMRSDLSSSPPCYQRLEKIDFMAKQGSK